jgi:hypothetical protein
MPTLQSPYPDAEIDTKDIGQILEEFIQEKWGFPSDPEDPDFVLGFTVDDVAWGAAGTKMDKRRKNITLRAYQFFSDIRDMVLGGHVNDYFELWRIDIFVRDAPTTTSRSPKLFKVLKHVEKIFLENKTGLQEKGISSVNLYSSNQIENPDSEDIYHGVTSLELRYVKNLI